MSAIYLIRHTTPDVKTGTCYGHLDLDVTAGFENEAQVIAGFLPEKFSEIHSSPLQRCSKLAARLFPEYDLNFHDDLREIHCGEWEGRLWDDIPRAELDPWMNDFVNVIIPGGESYVQLFERVSACFEKLAQGSLPAAIVSHGGVMRSILSHITSTPLQDSFDAFKLRYGCVVRLNKQVNDWSYEIINNPESPKEQHQPSTY
jgi:alpha-ribazole phosphatase